MKKTLFQASSFVLALFSVSAMADIITTNAEPKACPSTTNDGIRLTPYMSCEIQDSETAISSICISTIQSQPIARIVEKAPEKSQWTVLDTSPANGSASLNSSKSKKGGALLTIKDKQSTFFNIATVSTFMQVDLDNMEGVLHRKTVVNSLMKALDPTLADAIEEYSLKCKKL